MRSKYTAEDIEIMRHLRSRGKSYPEIADIFGDKSHTTIMYHLNATAKSKRTKRKQYRTGEMTINKIIATPKYIKTPQKPPQKPPPKMYKDYLKENNTKYLRDHKGNIVGFEPIPEKAHKKMIWHALHSDSFRDSD